MAAAPIPRRAPLEPMAPAVIGIGVAHVLLALVMWTVLSATRSQQATSPENLVWRSPADFLLESRVPQPDPLPQPIQEKNVASTSAPAAPVAPAQPEPPKVPLPPTNEAPARLTFTPAKEAMAPTAAAPSVLTTPRGTLSRLPPDTLAGILGANSPQMSLSLASDPPLLMPSAPVVATPSAPKPLKNPPTRPAPTPTELTKSQDKLPQKTLPSGAREANKYITLSAITDPADVRPQKPVLNLLDIAKLNEATQPAAPASLGLSLDAVEKAIQQALLREWKPPLISTVPADQRRVTVELGVLHDGSIRGAILTSLSGSQELDASVRAALRRVTKIPETLPSSFPKERYALRVNLQIE